MTRRHRAAVWLVLAVCVALLVLIVTDDTASPPATGPLVPMTASEAVPYVEEP